MVDANLKNELKTVGQWLKLKNKNFDAQTINSFTYIQLINDRLKGNSIESFITHSGLTKSETALLLHISDRSMQRLTTEKVLSQDISERLIELTKLFLLGNSVFGENKKFRTWIRRKCRALGDRKPLELMETNIGSELVVEELNRIEHGIFA